MRYLEHRFPLAEGIELPDPGDATALAFALRSSLVALPTRLQEALGGLLHGRRGEVEAETLRIDPDRLELEAPGRGKARFEFRECEFLACRLEHFKSPHALLLPFRLEGKEFVLAAPEREEDRVDDL